MLEGSLEYSVYVGNKESYIVKAQTFSRDNALKIAHARASQFPDFTINIEEWRFVSSSNPFDSGLFKGETITIPAVNRKEAA